MDGGYVMANKQDEFNKDLGLTEDDKLVLDERAAAATSQFASDFERQWLEHTQIAESSRRSDPMEGYENAPTVEVEDEE